MNQWVFRPYSRVGYHAHPKGNRVDRPRSKGWSGYLLLVEPLHVETIAQNARESIAVAAIAGFEKPANSSHLRRPKAAFLKIGVAPFRAIVSRRGTAKDRQKAAELYQHACDRGFAPACANLGWQYQLGDGVAKDIARAVLLYRQGCDGGDPNGCMNLEMVYENGVGGRQDSAAAAELWKRACDGMGYRPSDAPSCTNLGWVYEAERGVEKNVDRAVALYRQACTAKDAFGCTHLGWMYLNGAGVAQDAKRAAHLFDKACKLGDQAGCDEFLKTSKSTTEPKPQ